ncbi:hypothetical protein LTS08_002389 [Lithohypha guttulata]|nr:hypothetical protein LTS08_002389 [Lithohypha guttulata]
MQDGSRDRASRPMTTENIAARIQSLRNILSSERHTTAEQQVALEALDREEADRRQTIERESDSALTTGPRLYSNGEHWEPRGSTSPASVARERRRGFRPTARLAHQRDRMARLARTDPVEQVTTAASTLPPLHAARTRQASVELDLEAPPMREGRYPKRRKLDDGTFDEARQCPEYGLDGSLRPGNLQMKVLCAGNSYDARSTSDEIAKLNLWAADNSDVFRSKRRRCTILMKHQGGWPFSLSKLVVKIPKDDYDSMPLQGMVFIAMTDDKLLEKTSHYDSLEPVSYPVQRLRAYDSYRPSQDYLPRPRSLFGAPSHVRPMPRPHDAQWCDSNNFDEPVTIGLVEGFDTTVETVLEESSDVLSSPRSPRPWHDPDHEYTRRQYALRAETYRPNYAAEERRRIRAAAYAEAAEQSRASTTPSDSEDEDVPLYRGVPSSQRELNEAEYRQQVILEEMRERRNRGDGFTYHWTRYDNDGDTASHDHEVAGAQAASRSTNHTSSKRLPTTNEMTQNRSALSGSDDNDQKILPHARFQMVKQGGGISINFEPAISGKYILVKLWTRCPHSCVTVQGVVPYGYAGLRQLPDLSFR